MSSSLLGAIKRELTTTVPFVPIAVVVGLSIGLMDSLDGDGTAIGAIGYITAGFAIALYWTWSR